eukprot:m.136150 g.136150  ORF g.136150 m.136150 type:complete len:417 (+) comp9899_c1_seq4:5931-7181(+)
MSRISQEWPSSPLSMNAFVDSCEKKQREQTSSRSSSCYFRVRSKHSATPRTRELGLLSGLRTSCDCAQVYSRRNSSGCKNSSPSAKTSWMRPTRKSVLPLSMNSSFWHDIVNLRSSSQLAKQAKPSITWPSSGDSSKSGMSCALPLRASQAMCDPTARWASSKPSTKNFRQKTASCAPSCRHSIRRSSRRSKSSRKATRRHCAATPSLSASLLSCDGDDVASKDDVIDRATKQSSHHQKETHVGGKITSVYIFMLYNMVDDRGLTGQRLVQPATINLTHSEHVERSSERGSVAETDDVRCVSKNSELASCRLALFELTGADRFDECNLLVVKVAPLAAQHVVDLAQVTRVLDTTFFLGLSTLARLAGAELVRRAQPLEHLGRHRLTWEAWRHLPRGPCALASALLQGLFGGIAIRD